MNWKTPIASLFFILATTGLNAQELSDIHVKLKPGQWQSLQKVYFNGAHQQQFDLNNDKHCVTEAESNITVEAYFTKLMDGIDDTANCEFNDVNSQSGQHTFKLTCINSNGVKTDLNALYQQIKPDLIVFDSYGTLSHQGQSQKLRIEGGYSRIGECNSDIFSPPKKAIANSTIKGITISPTEINDYLKNNTFTKPVLVHYSSTDKNCAFCVNNNSQLNKYKKTLETQFHIVTVDFSPWQSFTKTHKQFGGIPLVVIYQGVVPIASVSGYKKNLKSEIRRVYATAKRILEADYSGLLLPTVEGKELATYIEQRNTNKPLLVHVTSDNEKACPFCVKNNAFYSAAAKKFSTKYNFIQVSYSDLDAFKTDKQLNEYLKQNNFKLGGLPVILHIDSSGRITQRSGIWPTILEDL